MAIVSINERFQDRTGTETLQELRSTRVFLIVTDSKYDDDATILASPSVVQLGATHPNNVNMWCRSRTCAQFEGSTYWLLTCEYSNRIEISSSDPADDAAEITWTTEQFQIVAEKDRNGEGVLNSAGDPFDPPPMRDFSRRVVTIRKNVQSVPSWILDYEDAVNSAPFTVGGLTIGAEKAKMQRVDIGPAQIRNNITYYPLTFELHLSRDGWDLKPLDQGFRELDGSGDLQQILNPSDKEPVTQPALLDASGHAIVNPTPSDAVYLSYNVYETRDFNILPLM